MILNIKTLIAYSWWFFRNQFNFLTLLECVYKIARLTVVLHGLGIGGEVESTVTQATLN